MSLFRKLLQQQQLTANCQTGRLPDDIVEISSAESILLAGKCHTVDGGGKCARHAVGNLGIVKNGVENFDEEIGAFHQTPC